MTTERLNYLLTGTETPIHTNEREKTIISECAKIITGLEQEANEYIDKALRDASRETFTNSQGKIMSKVQDIFVEAWKNENLNSEFKK